jgi:oligopeptidase A
MNTLLTNSEFIPFNQFSIADLDNALSLGLDNLNAQLEKTVATTISSWKEVISPLQEQIYHFNKLWGVAHHLLSVTDSKEIRELHNKFQPIIAEFFVNMQQNAKLYQHYKNIKATEYSQLNPEEQKILDNELRDFFLSGIELPEDKQQEFKAIKIKLSQLSTQYDHNLLDATDSYSKYVTLEELPGAPGETLQLYHNLAIKDGKNGLYKLTLHAPSYIPLMQYCDNRVLREELYHAYVTRASEFSTNTSWDNTDLIKQTVQLRNEEAKLLDFPDYNSMSLFTKMAKDSKEVINFLKSLAVKAKPQAQDELDELKAFAHNSSGINELNAWDIAYFSEKLQQQKYNYSTHELKQYFPLPKVIKGMFKLLNQLYQIEFSQTNNIPTWHKDVTTYQVRRNGLIIGYLYMDLFARLGKQNGAWMNALQDRYIDHTHNFLPHVYIVCNFTPPVNNQPSLLTFDEVQTLFHETGHAMHGLLTQINHYAIAGINGVEWDAVELPSQFMEYFAWNYNILTSISAHIQTQAPLPLELYNKLLAARYFQAGLQMIRQLEFSLFDMYLHSQEYINQSLDYQTLLDQVRQEVAVILPPKYNRFANSFSHIFAGGYAAGYYSYKWADVLACDAFSIFDNAKMEDYSELGNKFYTTILSQGGLNSMALNFKQFMGREPKVDALLKYSGIITR